MERRLKSRVRLLSSAVVAMVCGAAAPAWGQAQAPAEKLPLTTEQAATIFGLRETVGDVSLSPDGTKLASVEPVGPRSSALKILDLARPGAEPVPVMIASGDPDRLNWCRWTGANRLICEVYAVARLETGDLSYVNRLVAVNADGKNVQMLRTPNRSNMTWGYNTFGGSVIDWNPGKDGHVLVVQRYFPEFSTGTKISKQFEGLGVDDIDTANLSAHYIESPRLPAMDYTTDGIGHVRLMTLDAKISSDQYSSNDVKIVYRRKDNAEWLDLARYDRNTRTGFEPQFVDPRLDVVYGLKKLDGRVAAYSIALDGTKAETMLLARPDVDVSEFVTIGRNRRVVGASYVTDRTEVEYFDPQLKRLATALSKALPNLPLVHIVDSSQDEKKLLVWAGSDVDPGRYYLLDRATNGMEEVAADRLPLENVALAPVKSISIPTSDGAAIPAYLTLPLHSTGKNLPAIVMPHGGPSARDKWGFDWLAQFWASIGYAVLQPNFRGSSGYGDGWFQNNGFRSWRTAIGDVTESGRWLIKQGIADPGKLAIFGWSYGGYAALQASATQPGLFRAVIAVAPVTDLARLRDSAKRWSNYYLVEDFIGTGPHIVEGSPSQQASHIDAPVLLFHGTWDRNVDVVQSQLMADRLRDAKKSVQLVTYDKLDHYLDDSEARKDMLLKSAQFLETIFKAR